MAELTPLEYSYLRIKLRQAKGKYSVDIAKIVATEGRAGDIKLQDGDQIYIPPKMDVIWVSGQVKYPGLITYVEGKDWKYYIEQAGGYTNNRNIFGTRILRGDSGNWLKPSKKLVMRPGDTVFVPDKQDRDLWTDFRDVLSVTASAITIILGIQNLIY
jgi:protein involved in polysaccharide export with SLBB domain